MATTPTYDFKIKRRDTLNAFIGQLRDKKTNTPIDISGFQALRFHMFAVGSTTAKVDAAATSTNSTAGWVRYNWSSAGTDTNTAGVFNAEVEVTYANGRIQTYPNDQYLKVLVHEDLV